MSDEQYVALPVGARVLVEVGMWRGIESVITQIIPPHDKDDMSSTRYDVACAPGRWYYAYELSVVVGGNA